MPQARAMLVENWVGYTKTALQQNRFQVTGHHGSAVILVAVHVAELPVQPSVTDPASEPSD
jgi:hypothetical protein